MRLRKIELYNYQRPFISSFPTPHKVWRKAQSLIVVLEFDNGLRGCGESAPREYVTGESLSTVHRLFSEIFGPLLFQSKLNGAETIPNILDRAAIKCRNRGENKYFSALGAIDLALFSASENGNGEKIISANSLAINDPLPLSLSVPILPCEKIKDIFHQLKLDFFKNVKILMSDDKEENVARTSLVRNLFGAEADIRVEANGQWQYHQAVDNLKDLLKYNISSVEQPLAPNDLKELALLKRTLELPIILDESVKNLKELQSAIDFGIGDIVNIKISKCGGLYRSHQMASYAAKHGVRIQIGGHVGESPILARAGALLAHQLPNLDYFDACSYMLFDSLRNLKKLGPAAQSYIKTLVSNPIAFDTLKEHCQLVETMER